MRALLAMLAVIGCGSEPARPVASPVVSNKMAPPVLQPAPAGADDDLTLLPVDSEIVLGINVRHVLSSPIWQHVVATRLPADVTKGLGEFRTACGYDLLEALTSISIGVKGSGADKTAVIVLHGLPRDKTMACMAALEKTATGPGGTMTRDGDAILMTSHTGKTSAFEFIASDTALLVGMPGASKQELDTLALRRSALVTSPAFMDMFRTVRTNDSLWLLVSGNSPAMANLGINARPKAMFGSLELSDKVVLAFVVRMASADEARARGQLLQQQIANPQVRNLVDKLEVTTNEGDVDIAIELSEAKLQQMASMIAEMLGP